MRSGGISKGLFSSNNMALHVGDNATDVRANRDSLISRLGLLDTPQWLNQVHGTNVIYVPDAEEIPDADGSYTDKSLTICAVMTADCLPILLCDKAGSEVAAVHAGWRGLCHGVVRQAVGKFRSPTEQIMAFLGPAIGPKAFEVGPEVLESFLDNAQSQQHQKSIITAFKSTDNNQFNDHFFADLYALARAELVACWNRLNFWWGFLYILGQREALLLSKGTNNRAPCLANLVEIKLQLNISIPFVETIVPMIY